MAVMFSFNLTNQSNNDYGRIQSIFERFGWKSIGGSCYRYPPLGEEPNAEDWLNDVVPALMAFRSYVLKRGTVVTRYTLDAHSSSGYDGSFGRPPKRKVKLKEPSNGSFGIKNLKDWLDGCSESIPYD